MPGMGVRTPEIRDSSENRRSDRADRCQQHRAMFAAVSVPAVLGYHPAFSNRR